VFELPSQEEVKEILRLAEERKQVKKAVQQAAARWRCNNCTFINSVNDTTCAMCELGWTGKRECPTDKVSQMLVVTNLFMSADCFFDVYSGYVLEKMEVVPSSIPRHSSIVRFVIELDLIL
jgi:hypothetical protein